MHRRQFLRAGGLSVAALGVGGLLTACAADAARTVAGQPSLSFLPASFFPVAGQEQRVVFGLRDGNNEPIRDADLEFYTLDLDDEIISGPHDVTWHPDAGGTGLYLSRVAFPEPGTAQVAAVMGNDHGKQALQVTDPADSEIPVPGDDAIAVRTPTHDDDDGVDELCTLEPRCGAHETSLDQALDAGRPVLLLFATPAYCQTAVCGPAVEQFEALRADRDWGDLAFVHVEIFESPPHEDEIVAEPVQAWRLPSEPWLFAIDGQGTVVDRLDGALIAGEARDMAERLA